MDIKEQILVALGIEKTQKIKLEWQAKSEDGTIFVSTADELAEGVDISVLTEDGTTIPVPQGTYKTDEGVSFRVEEEKEYTDVEDWEGMEKRIQNLEDAVASLKEDHDKMDLKDDEHDCPNGYDDDGKCIEEEELAAPTKNPKTIKTTEVKEFSLEDLKAENEKLKTELAALPSAEPLQTNKFSSEKTKVTLSKKDYSKLSRREKFIHDLNN